MFKHNHEQDVMLVTDSTETAGGLVYEQKNTFTVTEGILTTAPPMHQCISKIQV